MRDGKLTTHLIGRRFGAWLVLERLPRRPGRDTDWLCRCECGVERAVRGYGLRAGISTSCGAAGCRQSRIDLRGQQYGDLTILHEGPRDLGGEPPGRTTWIASCACGRVCVVPTERLRHPSSPARSCGHEKLLPQPEGAPAPRHHPPPAAVNGNGHHHPLNAPELRGPVAVVAVHAGVYESRLMTPGTRFVYTLPDEFGATTLPSWVRVAPPLPSEPARDEPPDTAERTTTSQGVLDRAMRERHGGRMPGRRVSRPVTDDGDYSRATVDYDPFADS
jgi:hypothetical protein